MQISLVRRPEHIEVFVFTQKDAAQFPKLVDIFRELSHDLRGPMGSIKLINQRQVEMTIGTRELGVGIKSDFAWMGFGVIHCTRSMVRPIRAVVRKALSPHTARLVFLNNSRLTFLKGISRILPSWLSKMLAEPVERFQHLLEIVDGVPRGLELRLAYRHVPFHPEKQPMDPIREGVALLWYAPVIPMKGETVRRMIAMIGETLEKYSFPTAMSITTLSEKCGMGVIPVIYKPIEEKDRAYECFRELWHRGSELGCHPYRINIAAMPEMTEGNSTYWATVAQLKSAIDPNGILSPGRYTPSAPNNTF